MAETVEVVSVREAITEIYNKYGSLTSELVLREAKKKSSPLHEHFVWDDSEAAKQYRLIQAAELIRKVKVTYAPSEDVSYKVRAFVNVVSDKEDEENTKIYVPIKEALNNTNYREQLLAEAKRDAETFVKKYKVLNEVKDIINTIIAKDW
jgi:hypothetical protein